ncbi:MAG: 2-C-methyl-D-erythritol 2,4-cyclodiphosphate synthase [Paludibacteraceae bacterium]|nr:2-C-methyl-D-erythritol 2,4-cyclodiphosphate synthase [Paludibacteraceae bacterium]
MRIGIGYDVHAFAEGRDLILGGVKVPSERGLLGHSDADVLLHAIADALLGAAHLRDIGNQFPDNDPTTEGIDSKVIVRKAAELVREQGYEIVNIDSVIEAQAPKLNPYIAQMEETIAKTLGLKTEQVGVKATTTERLGFVGRKEGIAAQAVALLERKA